MNFNLNTFSKHYYYILQNFNKNILHIEKLSAKITRKKSYLFLYSISHQLEKRDRKSFLK